MRERKSEVDFSKILDLVSRRTPYLNRASHFQPFCRRILCNVGFLSTNELVPLVVAGEDLVLDRASPI